MGEGHNTDEGTVDAVHNAKRKTPERKTPIALIERFADVWQITKECDHPLRLPEEFEAQASGAHVADLHCGGEFLLCRRVKFWRHFFNEASSFRNTWSAGTSST